MQEAKDTFPVSIRELYPVFGFGCRYLQIQRQVFANVRDRDGKINCITLIRKISKQLITIAIVKNCVKIFANLLEKVVQLISVKLLGKRDCVFCFSTFQTLAGVRTGRAYWNLLAAGIVIPHCRAGGWSDSPASLSREGRPN
ncbi:MAG: hypothetical protein R2795_09780 [Saprospiraceae bacterium]